MKLKNILIIILGAGIFSFGIQYLVIPNHLFEGGVTGITLITLYLFKIPVSYMNAIINVPLFIIAWRLLGASTLYYSLIGTFSVSGWLLLFEQIPLVLPLQNDLFIVCILNGILLGTGLGLIFNAGGTTGGTDIVARIVAKYTHMSMGKLMLIVDSCVLAMVLLVFKDIRMVTYTLFFLFIATRVIDMIAEGGYTGKGFIIITEHFEKVASDITKELDRGVTFLHGQGYYSQSDLKIIYCIVARNQVQEMKDIVHRHDPHAFITITDAHEIMGEGFTLDENKQPIK